MLRMFLPKCPLPKEEGDGARLVSHNDASSRFCSRAGSGKGSATQPTSTLQRRRDEVLELLQQGKGIREIARELKMPLASVFKVLKAAGA